MMFAQQTLDNLPASFWKSFCIALLVLLGAAALVVAIWQPFRKQPPTRLDDDPPITTRKAPKRYNHDLNEQRYSDHERRIVALEKANSELLKQLENDKIEILNAGEKRGKEIHGRINYLLLAVGRIAGKLGVQIQGGDEGNL